VSSAQREHDTNRDAFPVPTTLLPSVVIMLPLSSQMTYYHDVTLRRKEED